MLMMRAIEAGIDFTVIVVDSRPKFEGTFKLMQERICWPNLFELELNALMF